MIRRRLILFGTLGLTLTLVLTLIFLSGEKSSASTNEPLINVERDKIHDYVDQTLEKLKYAKTDVDTTDEYAYSALLRFIGDNSSDTDLRATKTFIAFSLKVSDPIQQDKLVAIANNYRLKSNELQVQSEATTKKYHPKHETISSIDSKVLVKLAKDKIKLVKDALKDIEKDVSKEVKMAFVNLALERVKARLKLSKPMDSIEVDKEARRGLKPKGENVCHDCDEPYNPGIVSYTYGDTWMVLNIPSTGDLMEFDLADDNGDAPGYTNSNYTLYARTITEVNPGSNAHGIEQTIQIKNLTTNQIVSQAVVSQFYTGSNSFFSVTTSYTIDYDDDWEGNPDNGPFTEMVIAATSCPDAHPPISPIDIGPWGASFMKYEYSHTITEGYSYAFRHRDHAPLGLVRQDVDRF